MWWIYFAKKTTPILKRSTPTIPYPKKVVRESSGEGFLPEVTAVKGGQFRLFAIELQEALHQKETYAKWMLFEEFAKQHNALFYIVFPAGQVAQVKEKLKAFKIEARLWQASI